MAKILIVDDDQLNRQLLVQLLASRHHQMFEAADGEEALAIARSETPDLIISDVLMPTMDGYEFVRQLRADASICQTRVIFVTGHYLGREARALAASCGVSYVVYRPCGKDEILSTVAAALSSDPPEALVPALSRDDFDREHKQLLMDKSSDEVDELTALNHKLTALIDLSQQLASEHDPPKLVKKYSNLAREIIGAKWNAVGLINEETQTLRQFYTVGLNRETASRINPQSLREGVFADPIKHGRACRIRILNGDVEAVGLPSDFPALMSCLNVPIIFRDTLYGSFCLGDKLGAVEFSESDEKLAVTLVGLMAAALENVTLYHDSQQRAFDLEEKAQLTAQVEEQRLHLDTIIANVPGVVWTAWGEPDKASQRIDFVSDYVESLIGYSIEEWLSTPNFWLTIVHPEDRERAGRVSAAHYATGENYAQEFRWVARDGHIVWVETQTNVIRDAKGKSIGMRGVNLDITERKQAEEGQLKSRQQYESLVHSIDGIVWEMDVDNLKFTFVSQQVERFLGYTPKQMVDEVGFWTDHLHPDDRNWVIEFCQGAIARREDHQFDYRMIAADGRVVWLRDFVTVNDSDPENLRLRGVMVDITEPKRVEIEREIIFEVIKGVITTRNLGELFKLIHHSISKLLYAENCFVALHDPTTDLMSFEYWVDLLDPVPPAYELRKGFSDHVLRTNQPLLLTKEIRKQLFESHEVEKLGAESSSWMGVPLRTPTRVIGVLVVQNYETENAYSQRDLEFLTSVGDQIALAIERKRAEGENLKLLHDVGERVKELTALDRTAKSLRAENKTTAELLQEISVHLLASYQFPEITAVKIKVGKVECRSDNYRPSMWQQRADFVLTDGQRGSIEVVYLEARTDEVEGPFLAEERNLINSIAEMLRSTLERKRTDLALRDSEERYRDMVENARDIMYSHDLNGNYISINKAGELLTGYTREESLMMDVEQTLAPNDKGKVLQMIQRKLAGEEQTVYELEHIAKDGHRVTVEASTRLMYQDGVPIGVQGIARDITDRRRAEGEKNQLTAQVEQQRLRLNTIVANVPGVVWEGWVEPDHDAQRINFVSDYVETLLGYSVEDWLGTPHFWLSIVHPDDRDRAAENSAAHFARGESFAQEFRWIARDGHVVWVEAQTSIICDDQKKAIGARGVNIDITERKQAEEALRLSEEQLRQSHKLEAIGQLAGGIAHDFNNLLTVITGYSDLALRRLDEEHPLRSNIEEIRKAGERAASLTRQLLAFSRKQVLQPRVLELNAIVADVDKLLRRLIGEDVDLLTSLEPSISRIKADPGQIEQVIINLAVNARDAMPQGGKLTIETANVSIDDYYAGTHIAMQPGEYVMLAVSDNGCGMNIETQNKIFEPFYTTKGQGKGTGLGLSTVYGIVKQSEGNIWVYSEEGIGTTFKIYLPCVDECVESTGNGNGHATSELPQGFEMILLAEDEDQVRQMTRGILEMNGYRVLDANNGQEALSICKQHHGKIDLLLTDAVMPQMGGHELAENLKRLRPEIKVLYMSGYTADAIVRHGVLDHSISFLEKPFTPDALMRKLRDVLDAPSVH